MPAVLDGSQLSSPRWRALSRDLCRRILRWHALHAAARRSRGRRGDGDRNELACFRKAADLRRGSSASTRCCTSSIAGEARLFPIAVGLVGVVLATAAGSDDGAGHPLGRVGDSVTARGGRDRGRAREVEPTRRALRSCCVPLRWRPRSPRSGLPSHSCIWLAVVARRSLRSLRRLAASDPASYSAILFEGLSSGRLFENLRLFAFGGSGYGAGSRRRRTACISSPFATSVRAQS